MVRYIIFGVLIYLIYLGVKTFMVKFQKIKDLFGSSSHKPQGSKYSKKDLNSIEDADFEEIKKS
jgi:hypothetical protein